MLIHSTNHTMTETKFMYSLKFNAMYERQLWVRTWSLATN